MHRGSSGRTIYAPAVTQGCSSRPNGLRIPPRCSKGSGVNITPRLSKTIVAPESHARGRHLLEGSLPSGNSKSR